MGDVKPAFGIFALAVLLALLLVLRGDLLGRVTTTIRKPSVLFNVSLEQVTTPLKAFSPEHQMIPESFYPVVRAAS